MAQDKNFDTLLIAETGNRLKAISGTFGYYDVAYPDVLFIGTSVWSNTNLNKETTLLICTPSNQRILNTTDVQ